MTTPRLTPTLVMMPTPPACSTCGKRAGFSVEEDEIADVFCSVTCALVIYPRGVVSFDVLFTKNQDGTVRTKTVTP